MPPTLDYQPRGRRQARPTGPHDDAWLAIQLSVAALFAALLPRVLYWIDTPTRMFDRSFFTFICSTLFFWSVAIVIAFMSLVKGIRAIQNGVPGVGLRIATTLSGVIFTGLTLFVAFVIFRPHLK